MTTNPVSSLPAPLSQMGTREVPGSKDSNNELGQDAFLKLLVAQLKYQDPLNPADGAEFLAQTAQFTMVEKLADLTSQGESSMTSQMQMQAAQLVGKQVTYVDASGIPVQGVVESAEYTPDSQTLIINGEQVALENVTTVFGSSSELGVSEAVSALGPSLASSLAPALIEALRESSTSTSDSDASVAGVDATPDESPVQDDSTLTESVEPLSDSSPDASDVGADPDKPTEEVG